MTAVLVTGASGFIGRAACAEFAKRGWTVRAGVRTATTDLAKGWPLEGVDVVVHLAGIAHQIHAQNAEAVYQALNCEATERLASAAAEAGLLLQVGRWFFIKQESRAVSPIAQW